jgi:hypothetical protein
MLDTIKSFISKFWLKISFFVFGIGALVWFLVRVIPKPSRAQYPCMKAAAPVASSFVSYLLGITMFAFVVNKAKQQLIRSKYFAAIGFVVLGLVAGSWAVYNNSEKASAQPLADDQPVNQPAGEAKGIFPGRVVWAHDPNATNEKCTNGNNDFWSLDKNNDQAVVTKMVSASIQQLTGANSDAGAWDLIFKYYNKNHDRGDVGYQKGEKIVIKLNLNGLNGNAPTQKNVNTSPHLCLSILDQLVNNAGVDQSDIYIGDPGINMSNTTYKKCHDVFPDVNYLGSGWDQYGVSSSGDDVFHYSDGISDPIPLPQEYVDASYLINIPVFKKHHRAGISICCKNHVGTINIFSNQNYANGDWHESLPAPSGGGENINGDYGVYRCFVDIMGHKDLGGKTVLYLVDGLWGSVNWGHPCVKFSMPPFNNDWPSSLFTSFDPVAIESVCYDFLYYEFDENHPTEGGEITDSKGPFPHFNGVDDFLHQAADPSEWPAGIQYDPEGDGTILKSMGTHEHWNNAVDKQYSKNLSSSGKGIELYKANVTGKNDILAQNKSSFVTNYPNPVNGSTTIKFQLDSPSEVSLSVYSLDGKKIGYVSLGKLDRGAQNIVLNQDNGLPTQSGLYNYVVEIRNNKGRTQLANRMMVVN